MSVLTKNDRWRWPRGWKSALLLVTLIKGFVAGAGLGIAALGLTELVNAALSEAGIVQPWAVLQREHVFEVFAIGGGILSSISTLGKILWNALFR